MPSTPTEAKHTPLPWAADAPDWYGDINIVPTHESLVIGTIVRNGFRSDVETAANAAIIVQCVNERSSLLSLIEGMAKALEPFANQAETFDSDGKEFVPDQFEPAIVGHTIGDLRKSRSALSRYTEFLRALSAQEGSK